MWSTVAYGGKISINKDPKIDHKNVCPSARCKHSVTLLGNCLYLLGGRHGNLPLKDFWRYDIGNNTWQQVEGNGDNPPSLQDHTTVAYNDCLYVFGGEVSFSSANETPLWVYQAKDNLWRKINGQKGAHAPKGRRGHSALLYNASSLLVYGGYCDLKGSSSELWVFHFETESWHLLLNGRHHPPGRHKHTAVIHDNIMWVYGGMTDLEERGDLWKFDIKAKRWMLVKCKFSPGVLHSHAACNLGNCMMLFGGESNGQLRNELWKFYFATETWERIYTGNDGPPPMAECRAIAVTRSDLESDDEKEEKNDGGYKENAPPRTIQRRASSANEPFDPGRWYCAANSVDGSNVLQAMPPRRQATTPNSCSVAILRDIGKLSQMNLSLLGNQMNRNCNYRTLRSNSEESVNNLEEESGYGYSVASISSLKSPHTSKSFMVRETNSCNSSNAMLTPVEAAKLVYLDDEEAPCISRLMVEEEEIPMSDMSLKNRINNGIKNSANSVRFANPLVTPEESPEITSDYASCENIHRLRATKSPTLTEAPISFSNPNYQNSSGKHIQMTNYDAFADRSVKKNYARALQQQTSSSKTGNGQYEMLEMRPAPPRSLPLLNAVNTHTATEKRACYARACSAGRYSTKTIGDVDVFIIGGKEQMKAVSYKQPISMWKLSITTTKYYAR